MLLARAHRKMGAIPHELVVRHVLAVMAGADWPVRRVEPPIQGGCPDFLRGSLGPCKHLLAVLEDIASKPRAVVVPAALKPQWLRELTVKQLDPPYRLVLTGTPMENPAR